MQLTAPLAKDQSDTSSHDDLQTCNLHTRNLHWQ